MWSFPCSSLISVAHRAFVQAQRIKILASADLLEVIAFAARAFDIISKRHLNAVRLLGMKPVVAIEVVMFVADKLIGEYISYILAVYSSV